MDAIRTYIELNHKLLYEMVKVWGVILTTFVFSKVDFLMHNAIVVVTVGKAWYMDAEFLELLKLQVGVFSLLVGAAFTMIKIFTTIRDR